MLKIEVAEFWAEEARFWKGRYYDLLTERRWHHRVLVTWAVLAGPVGYVLGVWVGRHP